MKKLYFIILTLSCMNIEAQNHFFVSADKGDDTFDGSMNSPFNTVSKGVEQLMPGDTLSIFGGVYRECITLKSAGVKDKPITIQAYRQNYVEVSGLRKLEEKWKSLDQENNIYAAKIDLRNFDALFLDNNFQVFVNGKQMLEARWPNCSYDQLLDRASWSGGGKESQFGTIYGTELIGSDMEIEGADIYLNIIHQFFTWKREVNAFNPESGEIKYTTDIVLPPLFFQGWFAEHGWKDDYFYLQGKYSFLDFPGEFFLDTESSELYLIPPVGVDIDSACIEIKVRNYGLVANDKDYINIKNLSFFGCAMRMSNCDHLSVEGCVLQFPAYNREVGEVVRNGKGRKMRSEKIGTSISGKNVVVRDMYLSHSPTGISFHGEQSILRNSVFHDICTSGSLMDKAISGGGEGVIITRNTVFKTGNVGMHLSGGGFICSYNDVYEAGRLSHDVSNIYTSGMGAYKARITHNWVHDNHSTIGASGIRGDDLTRGLTVDHNVVWNINERAISVKGDSNTVYNNTCFNNERGDIFLPSRPEPRKQFQVEDGKKFLDAQNQNSFVFNNLGRIFTSDKKLLTPLRVGEEKGNYIYEGRIPLMDINNRNFLLTAAALNEFIAFPYPEHTIIPVELDAEQPYIGAYAPGKPPWSAGAVNGLRMSISKGHKSSILTLRYNLPLTEDDELGVFVDKNLIEKRVVTKQQSFQSITIELPADLINLESDVSFISREHGRITIFMESILSRNELKGYFKEQVINL